MAGMSEHTDGPDGTDSTDKTKPLDPLSDFSIPGDTDLHTTGDASGADGDDVAEPGADED
ncbi:hypothetical protein C5C18_01060 [Rathayibacter tritici]|nr:hypothetical protein C5C06_01330 [Rathayibacter tritici]PPF67298.1 hypothetical protein C5C21_07305 [Rathayibacter tritici]PPG09596.1 hypothetical protein C5C18_01060 [Rathayibacter tritici]PPI14232.1 hypothetical protein C5D07_09255 [Rathayibacter tritici]PPI43459.1 hypothetical protein C5D18_09490 [Rathayibacter tritici]